jgi:hypothetical protein
MQRVFCVPPMMEKIDDLDMATDDGVTVKYTKSYSKLKLAVDGFTFHVFCRRA